MLDSSEGLHHGLHMVTWQHVLSHVLTRQRELWFLHLLLRALIPRGSTLMTSSKLKHLPNDLPPDSITSGISASYMVFGLVVLDFRRK